MRLFITFALSFGMVALGYSQEPSHASGKLTLKNGTRLTGSFVEMGTDAVIIRTSAGQMLRVPNHKIRKIVLAKGNEAEPEARVFTVQLMDGSEISGVQFGSDLEQLPMVDLQGNPIFLDFSQIQSIEPMGFNQRSTHQKAGGKFFHWMEFGGLFAGNTGGETTTAFSVRTVNGYQLWNFLETGLGVGFDFYNDFTALPVYLSAHADLMKARVIPYYYGGIGYGFAWQSSNSDYEQVKGGINWSAGAGLKIPLDKIALVFSAGYSHQVITSITGDITEMGFETEQERKYRRFSLTTGITF